MTKRTRAILDGKAPKPWAKGRNFNDRRKPKHRLCRSCGLAAAARRSRFCGPCRIEWAEEREERARLRRITRRKRFRAGYFAGRGSGLMTRDEALRIFGQIKADRLAREAATA